jgi:hypothetical protein
MKYWKSIPDCFDVVKRTVRIPMVVVIPINIQIAKALRASLDIDQKQLFLTKNNRVMFDIEIKIHTPSI